jgi:7-keto-8-aminopelargonate synthetase-like enzyme
MSTTSRARLIKTVQRLVGEAADLGLVMNQAGSANGAECVVNGVELKNFGSCSYMGIERHPRLLEGAQAALREFGTQFHFSRAYLESPLYLQLEDALDRMTGRHVLVAPSTTLAHLAALPVLVGDRDVVLIDQFAHASLHMATELLKNNLIERVRHNRMDLLEEKVLKHAGSAERVWYICDGVYSMLGDFADFDGLEALLERYPQLHVYIDDAHAISWCGKSGRGAALSRFGQCDRVIVAMSLNKAFSAAGGALAFPTEELRKRVRLCGSPMLFSGPIQPPMLGAAVASAELHLDPSFAAMQEELEQRILVAEQAIAQHGLRVANNARTPIFMVQFEAPKALHRALHAMRARGYYCCLSTFPAVPLDKPSLRFTVSRHNARDEIARFIEHLADVVRPRREEQAAVLA